MFVTKPGPVMFTPSIIGRSMRMNKPASSMRGGCCLRGGATADVLKDLASIALPLIATAVIREGAPKVIDYINKKKKPVSKPITNASKPTGRPRQKKIESVSSRSKNVLNEMIMEGKGMRYF
jgi:hypothetical protein